MIHNVKEKRRSLQSIVLNNNKETTPYRLLTVVDSRRKIEVDALFCNTYSFILVIEDVHVYASVHCLLHDNKWQG